MNAIENMHELRFSNIYILSHVIYHIHPLTIIFVLAIKAADFFADFFAMHYGSYQRLNMIFFNLDFLLFQTITPSLKR